MKKLILIIFAVVLVSGCATDFYKDIAVDRARDYIYDNCPNMSVQNESFIKYTYPRIETAPIYASAVVSKTPFNQICFAWDLPSPRATIRVIGASSNYFDWHPIRMTIQDTSAPAPLATSGNVDTSKAARN